MTPADTSDPNDHDNRQHAPGLAAPLADYSC